MAIFKPKLLKAFATLAICLSTQISFVVAATYHVSSSLGNDANDGLTEHTPWKSLEKITKQGLSSFKFVPGDKILLKADDTWYGSIVLWTCSGTEEAPITIGRYGVGADPVIYGDYATAIWSPVPGHAGVYRTHTGAVTIFGPVIEGTMKYTGISPGTIPWWQGGSALDDYLNLLQPGSYTKVTNDTAFIKTLDGNSPVNIKIFVDAVLSIKGQYLIVENLNIQRTVKGIDISNSDHAIIRNNLIQDTLNIAIYLRWDNTNCLVENNIVQRAGNTALYILTGHNNTFRGNTVDTVSHTVLGINVGNTDACGIGLQSSMNNLIEHNSVSNVMRSGVDYWYETGTVVRYNYFFHNGGGAYPHGTGLSLHGNIFNNDGAGPGTNTGHAYDSTESAAPDAGPILIYNNVYYKTISYGIMGGGAGLIYRNNIVISSMSTNLTLFTSGVDSDYNCFYSWNGSARFNWMSKGYQSFAQYQSASGLDTHSIYADPQFVSANPVTADDFKLKSTSPCIDAGQDLKRAGLLSRSEEYKDFLDAFIPYGSAPDIGAYEYGASATTPSDGYPGTYFLPFKNVINLTKGETIKVNYNAPVGAEATLSVYDRRGNEITPLNLGPNVDTIWDGRNSQGSVVASGVYFLILKVDGVTQTKKVVVVK